MDRLVAAVIFYGVLSAVTVILATILLVRYGSIDNLDEGSWFVKRFSKRRPQPATGTQDAYIQTVQLTTPQLARLCNVHAGYMKRGRMDQDIVFVLNLMAEGRHANLLSSKQSQFIIPGAARQHLGARGLGRTPMPALA